MKVKHETWVTPHALFEIGIIYYLNNKPAKALKRFNKVKSNYDSMFFFNIQMIKVYLFLDYDFRNILLRELALWIDKSNGVNYHSFVDNIELPSTKSSPRKLVSQSSSPGRF